jgi:hypothetical protein
MQTEIKFSRSLVLLPVPSHFQNQRQQSILLLLAAAAVVDPTLVVVARVVALLPGQMLL